MCGATDVGRRRKSNQDSIFYDQNAGFGIVADGIGGRRGGEVASSMAVNGLKKSFMNCDRIRHEEATPFLISHIDKCNREILERGRKEEAVAGMGTTLNCVLFVGDRLHLAHIGDSRTYLYHKRHIFQLTLDHSVGNFVKRGWLSPSAIASGASEGALVRALGLTNHCEVDIYETAVQAEQIYLTCSDGLSSMVSDQQIAEIINKHQGDFSSLPQKLIDAANEAGGKDNITVLVTRVGG